MPSQPLNTAAQLMQAGRFAEARVLLEAHVRSGHGEARAYWLLGGALLNLNDLAAAESAARSAVALDSRNPAPLAMLGEILRSGGQLAAAEHALRQALDLEPRHVPTVMRLVEVLLARGAAAAAVQTIDATLRRVAATPPLLLLRAHALSAAGERQGAIAAFQQAVAAAPTDGNARLGLAAALSDDGEHVAAEATARRVLTPGHDSAEARFVLARALLGQRRFEEAETELRHAIRLRPDYVEAHINLAEASWMRSGDADAVAAEIDASLRKIPGNTPLQVLKAKLLEAAGNPTAALAVLDAAITTSGNDPALHIAAAQTALKCDAARSLAYAAQARKLVADNPLTLSIYGNALLATGHAAEAEALAAQLLDRDPVDGLALALRATAWRMLDDPRYRGLYDYDHFIRPDTIDTPDGWPDLASYLGDLASSLLQRHTLRTHPIGQSLRHGTQVDLSLAHADAPAIRAFAQAIDGPIHRYMDALGDGADPFRRRNTHRYKLTGIWSVRLRSSGYHFNHYHPDGWLSSACYIQLPPGLGSHGGEGWLEFGEPAFPTTPPLPAEYFVRPEPGLLVLFPAWFWHGTVPFQAAPDAGRLTIAFDVVPG